MPILKTNPETLAERTLKAHAKITEALQDQQEVFIRRWFDMQSSMKWPLPVSDWLQKWDLTNWPRK